MALLARLAGQLGALRETVATDALGHLLSDPNAAAALTAAIGSGVAELPRPLRYLTQAADGDSRPDVVGRDEHREVVHVEGKFWAGLTDAQANDRYLQRLLDQHRSSGTTNPCRGALLWVCPQRRVESLWREVCHTSEADPRPVAGRWRFADTRSGQVVALTDWVAVCDVLEQAGGKNLAEDVRQFRALIEEVDRHGFVPWSVSDLTDQHAARQWVAIRDVAGTIRSVAQKNGVATRATATRNSNASGAMWGGPVMRLANIYTGLVVSLPLFAEYGLSPLWLRWWYGPAEVARRAFPGQTVERRNGCALPVPFAPGRLESEVVDDAVAFLAECAERLAAAVRPSDALDFLEDEGLGVDGDAELPEPG
ncbi:hypothetical protein [Micromonospora sp. NPDC023888]|uniref:hypothetical protein n=1 Tax=Micromonospora sp. NPDC023888 TaxID=3155607 RepID=UPI003411C237